MALSNKTKAGIIKLTKFYSFIYKSLSSLFKKLYRVEIIGAENEPENGPFIVCANHLSNHDVVLLAACLKHQVRYLAKAELFKIPLLKQLITALGAFPVDRKKGDVAAIKKMIQLIEDGEVIGVFPQGHRFPKVHPATTPVKHGTGLVACKTKATILPVAIENKKMKLGFFRKTVLKIGKPIDFSEFGEIPSNKSGYELVTGEVFAKICAMVEYPALPASDTEDKGTK